MATPALWISSLLRYPPIPHTTSPLSLFRFGLLTNLLDTAFTSAGFAPTPTLPVLLMISLLRLSLLRPFTDLPPN